MEKTRFERYFGATKTVKRIAVKTKHGVVVAFALVDDKDFARVKPFRWRRHSAGYAEARMPVNGRSQKVLLHRFVFNARKGTLVDHRNRRPMDCRRRNLRYCSRVQNMRNSDKKRNGTSRFRGVSWHAEDKRWVSQIVVKGQHIFLGTFHDEREAARAYRRAVLKYHGRFACLKRTG